MFWRKLRHWFGLLLMVASMVCLFWGFWPLAASSRQINLPTALRFSALDPIPLPDARSLDLQWPSTLRTGDLRRVRLDLLPFSDADRPASLVSGAEPSATAPIQGTGPDQTHYIFLEARLDVAGLQVAPVAEVMQPLLIGRPVTFVWSVRAQDAGAYRGTLWLHLLLVPVAGGEEIRQPLSAQLVEIHAGSLAGLSALQARTVGVVGFILALVLIWPALLVMLQGLVRRYWSPVPFSSNTTKEEGSRNA